MPAKTRLPSRHQVPARIAQHRIEAHNHAPHLQHGRAGELLDLQRSVGNQAVMRLIQRLPTAAAVKSQLGGKKRSWRIGHGSTKYTAVLNALDAYQNYITSTQIDPGGFAGQFSQMLALLTTLDNAVNAYGGKKGDKADYFTNVLKPGIARERQLIGQSFLAAKSKGVPQYLTGITLANFLLRSVGGRTKELHESQKSGSDKGGTSEVTKFKDGGEDSFFKENKETLQDYNTDDEAQIKVDLVTKHGEKGQEMFNSMQNEKSLGVDLLGIDKNDAHMAKRDVALYRLDQLLGAGVTAQAELALRHMPQGGTKLGSLMKGAKGTQGHKFLEGDKLGEDDEEKSKMTDDTISMSDPALMRLMSRLQLIDLLAMQVDRNPKNYFIQTNKRGKVLGITGIDNDFAFGTKDYDVKEKTLKSGKVVKTDPLARSQQELPGFSRYVDKALAQAIIDVDLEMVRLVMMDLLSPGEIDALIKRFQRVQSELKDKQTFLLEEDEWTDGVRKGLMDEKKSYFFNMYEMQASKFTPQQFKEKKKARGKKALYT